MMGMEKETKICPKCKLELSKDFFVKNRARSDGVGVYCKKCDSIYRRERINNYAKKQREKNLKNEEKISLDFKKCCCCSETKTIKDFFRNKYAIDGFTYDCKKCRAERSQSYRQKEENREKIRKADRERRRNNPCLRLHKNVSRFISKKLITKEESITKHLPYSFEELRQHLESLWEPWMNWENYGKLSKNKKTWNIDHIIPQSLLVYDDYKHPNFLKCWCLENLRPLDALENTIKKDNILIKEGEK